MKPAAPPLPHPNDGPALPADSPALARRAQRVAFPLLADPAEYVACPTDLTGSPKRRAYWLDLFRDHLGSLLAGYEMEAAERGIANDEVRRQRQAAEIDFLTYLDTLRADPAAYGRLDILSICWAREDALQRAGIVDAYAIPKREETQTALALLPALLSELGALDDTERFAAIVRGVFAGNIFDLGAKETIALFEGGDIDFEVVRARLKPRPWRIDDFDAMADRFDTAKHPPHHGAVLFVDNAGPDVVLGMLPLARELLRRGTGVVLTANTLPSLNDVTYDELVALLDAVAALDPLVAAAWSDGRLEAVPSGNDAPLIDLTAVSPELAEACGRRGVDLVVLEGMGRSLESNFETPLACDTVKVCMVKDRGVAETIGAELYDLVLRFEPAPGRATPGDRNPAVQ